VATAFYQYLEALRVRVKLVAGAGAKPAASSIPPPAGSDPWTPLLAPAFAAVAGRWPARLVVAAMFRVNSGLGYLLMLAVMLFNGSVFVAVVVGLALGYLPCSSGRIAGARRLKRIRCANHSAPPVLRLCL
jgi:solute carrier family 31 (copper transporter), member 1